MYLIIRKDTHEFFTGYRVNPTKPKFHHSPTIARRYQSKINADGKIQDIRAGHPHTVSGAQLEVIEPQKEHREGRFFTYYLFEAFLIISRKTYPKEDEDWVQIMNDDLSHEAKWHEVTVDDDSNGIAHPIQPEEIGALTEAPIIGFDVGRDTDGTIKVYDDSYLYWFPAYMTVDEFACLSREGYVVFDRALISTKSEENEST